MRIRATLLLLILLLSGCNVLSSIAKAPADHAERDHASDNRYAVIVGVDRYRHYAPLDYSVADSNLLAEVLRKKGYQVQLLQNYDADPESVLDTLRATGKLMQEQGDDGTLIFAFSGHGFHQDGTNYLAMGGAHPDRLRQTALSMERIKRVLRNRVPGKRVLFIDACRNDPTRSGTGREQNFIDDTSAEGLAILYSTAAGDWSWEDASIEHGVFSYYVAKGLDNPDIATDDKITFNDLASHVSREVSRHVYRRFTRVQTPYQAGERTGEFILANASRGKNVNVPWRTLSLLLGVVAIGTLVSSGGSESDSGNVTLVLPVP